METHGLAAKMIAKLLKIARNCESSARLARRRREVFDRGICGRGRRCRRRNGRGIDDLFYPGRLRGDVSRSDPSRLIGDLAGVRDHAVLRGNVNGRRFELRFSEHLRLNISCNRGVVRLVARRANEEMDGNHKKNRIGVPAWMCRLIVLGGNSGPKDL